MSTWFTLMGNRRRQRPSPLCQGGMSMVRFSSANKRRSTAVAIVLLVLCLLSGKGATEESASGAVQTAFDAIEAAWSLGDAEALGSRFGERKVLLRLPGSQAEARRFSRQQSLLILRDHFASCDIRKFEFMQVKTPESEQGVAVGLATSSWRKRGVGRFKEERVLVALVQEEARWVISTIQSLR